VLLEGLKDLGLEASRGARRCGRNKDAKGMKLMTNKELRTPSRRFSESAGQYYLATFPPFRKKREKDGATVADMDWATSCTGLAGHGAGGDGVGAGREHDNGAGGRCIWQTGSRVRELW